MYIVFAILAVFSVLQIRRKVYELFIHTHAMFATTGLVMLWLHVRTSDKYLLICLITAAGLYLVEKVLWVSYIVYRNFSSRPPSCASLARFQNAGSIGEVVQVHLNVKRPWVVQPGQFIYLSLPRLRSMGLGLLESHPFMIAWTEALQKNEMEGTKDKAGKVVLLVQAHKGFTRRMLLANTLQSAFLEGPYGGNELASLTKYDKLLFMSSGIGIAAHLFTARYMLLAHNEQVARVRRLTLLWVLETQGDLTRRTTRRMINISPEQMLWAKEFLSRLDAMDDRRKILTIFCSFPDLTVGSSEAPPTNLPIKEPNIVELPSDVDLKWLINNEWNAEAGNMLVSGTYFSNGLSELR